MDEKDTKEHIKKAKDAFKSILLATKDGSTFADDMIDRLNGTVEESHRFYALLEFALDHAGTQYSVTDLSTLASRVLKQETHRQGLSIVFNHILGKKASS
jgi:hypothetical protein